MYARTHAMRPRTCSREQQSVQSSLRKVLYKETECSPRVGHVYHPYHHPPTPPHPYSSPPHQGSGRERCEMLTLDLTWPTDPRTLSREVTCRRPARGPANGLSSMGEGALQAPPLTEEQLIAVGRELIVEYVCTGRFPMVHWVVPHSCPRGLH